MAPDLETRLLEKRPDRVFLRSGTLAAWAGHEHDVLLLALYHAHEVRQLEERDRANSADA